MTSGDSGSFPKISVILPIRNEERFIAQTLSYILAQEYPRDKVEILVVDGQSTDNTCHIVQTIAQSDSRVALLDNPQRLSSAARAIGASQATGGIITFIDGHTYIDNTQLLANTARLMSQQNLSVLSRPQFLDTPDNSFFQRAVSLARKNPLGHGLDSTIYTTAESLVDPTSSGASYRRELFSKVGNFDTRFDACEDVEFNYRVAQAGFQSYTSPRLAVYYYPRETLRGLFKQLKRYGVGRRRLASKYPASLSLGTMIPPAFVLGICGLGLASLFSAAVAKLFLAGIAAYLTITILVSAWIALRNGLAFFPILPPIFWTIHWSLGYGFLLESVKRLAGMGPDFHHSPSSTDPAGSSQSR